MKNTIKECIELLSREGINSKRLVKEKLTSLMENDLMDETAQINYELLVGMLDEHGIDILDKLVGYFIGD